MLPQWDPNRLTAKIPFVLGLVGGRRQGKSTAVADLLSRMSGRFDLVLCMVGSAACNPVLEGLLHEYWDDRFFFPEWDYELMDKLLIQQERLQKGGGRREVLILIDDVVLGSQAEDQLAHMCMRGRHFAVSVCMCAVSYTSLPKRARRSLDTLLVFSCPMKGDMQILTWEYCQNQNMARFALSTLKDYQCLVLETLEKKQTLFVWRADLIGLELEPANESSQEPSKSENEPSRETLEEHQPSSHQTNNPSLSNRTELSESLEASEPASVSLQNQPSQF